MGWWVAVYWDWWLARSPLRSDRLGALGWLGAAVVLMLTAAIAVWVIGQIPAAMPVLNSEVI